MEESILITPTSRDEIRSIPIYSQFTDKQIKNQLAKNAAGFRQMERRAIKTGKKQGGFTSAKLNEMAVRYENLSK